MNQNMIMAHMVIGMQKEMDALSDQERILLLDSWNGLDNIIENTISHHNYINGFCEKYKESLVGINIGEDLIQPFSGKMVAELMDEHGRPFNELMKEVLKKSKLPVNCFVKIFEENESKLESSKKPVGNDDLAGILHEANTVGVDHILEATPEQDGPFYILMTCIKSDNQGKEISESSFLKRTESENLMEFDSYEMVRAFVDRAIANFLTYRGDPVLPSFPCGVRKISYKIVTQPQN